MADDLIHRAHALGKRVSGHPERQAEVVPQLIGLLLHASGPEAGWDEDRDPELLAPALQACESGPPVSQMS